MNNTDFLASQHLLAAKILTEGLEWEWIPLKNRVVEDWRPADGFSLGWHIVNSHEIRIKPFSLPSPSPGRQWHRTDGWTKEMLPEGMRPLLYDEPLLLN